MADNAINADVGESVIAGIEDCAVLSSALNVLPSGAMHIGTVWADVYVNNVFISL